MTGTPMKEGWVGFMRYACTAGYIDRWMGDCADDPNKPAASRLHLNMTASYYRLNGGEWVHSYRFDGRFFSALLDLMAAFPAEEIWAAYYSPDEVSQ